MDCVEIRGGKPLCGRVEIQGSKNAVLPILAACVLHEGTSRIDHCPRIQDVFDTIVILELLGCRVWWEGHCLAVDASQISQWQIPAQIAPVISASDNVGVVRLLILISCTCHHFSVIISAPQIQILFYSHIHIYP